VGIEDLGPIDADGSNVVFGFVVEIYVFIHNGSGHEFTGWKMLC
jgi:hypothetical protein